MMIEKNTSNGSLDGSGGDGSRFELELKSLARVDMKKMSQSELYSLSRCSSSAFNIQSTENVVTPNIESDHHSTIPIATTSTSTTAPSKVFAFSGHRRRISASINDDVDPQLTENRFILNFLENLVAGGEVNDSNPRSRREMVAVADNEGGVQKRKRKRKSKETAEKSEEFEGFAVINVNGEKIDLKFLARVADGAFEAELNRLTEGMVREDEFLGFLKGLEGRWGSSRKRRRYVDAADFVKALPINWKILLSLRPRARQPSLYCRRFVSPSDMHFKSCKEVAFYLKSQFATNDVNPIKVAMCQQDLKSEVEASKEPKNNSQVKRNLKARCIWCLIEFFHEPVDAKTLMSSSGFICPKCKENISGKLENTLSRFYHHDNK
ncbi:hypothetical protein LXL04_001421 [Taraxacum kok-saghyz]